MVRRTFSLLFLLAVAVVGGAAVCGPHRAPGDAGRITSAALAFLASLDDQQRKLACFGADDPLRKDWHFVPRDRPGVSFRRLSDPQRAAARDLLRATLSSRGVLKTETVMQLDGVLRDLAAAGGREDPSRDPLAYYITIFGAPSTDTPWGWRLEGHHVSISVGIIDSEVVGCTPAFLGANPARVASGPHAGLRALAAEDDLGLELISSLDEDQRRMAILPGDTPREIIMGPGRDALPAPAGIAASSLLPGQFAILERLIDEYLGNLAHETAARKWSQIRATGWEKVRFAWCGGTEAGIPRYYRVQGPRFIIEFDDTQNEANHIHSVFRDLDEDFGGDPLREHYREHRHD